jgi:hybrid cluster-associated redox disulfide protein
MTTKKEPVKDTTDKLVVTKDYNLLQLLDEYPDLAEVLNDFGLHCAGCAFSAFDSIETGAKVHQLDDEEIQEMVTRINEFIEFGE